jgi:hypothetical protein
VVIFLILVPALRVAGRMHRTWVSSRVVKVLSSRASSQHSPFMTVSNDSYAIFFLLLMFDE